jgi:hypothetical protein
MNRGKAVSKNRQISWIYTNDHAELVLRVEFCAALAGISFQHLSTLIPSQVTVKSYAPVGGWAEPCLSLDKALTLWP